MSGLDINEEIFDLDSSKPEDDGYRPEEHITRLSGMYQDWFLDYASYVILERAVPHLNDGLKPVQRRILHSMQRLDDGRFNKVANIIGHTMQFHPHGDASIGDALVQVGQKDLLIETQGNWGNIFTGDDAAAARYIEARLSKFALEVVFNAKTTVWKSSYDGRNKEPVTLPVKFPLLLAQGIEGIAVGLASKILPHNFIELIDASIAVLEEREFKLFPDFPTGGFIDVSKYNDGLRGGSIRVRARINKLDKKTLSITEVPYGKTTTSLIDSIVKANDKGKIRIRKIDDNTAENVEILVHLAPGIEPDKTIDALYAFTDCESPISPNSCIIDNNKPLFLGVEEILKISTRNTLKLLNKELEIKLGELNEAWHLSSLEKIFIENELYENIKECKTEEEILTTIGKSLEPFKSQLMREITQDDLVRLSNIPIKRISKFSAFKADEHIKDIEKQIKQVNKDIKGIIPYTIAYFEKIKKKYGPGRERKTEIRSFDTIEATKVVVASQKLYVNKSEGFIGTGLKKDEYVCDCSDIDDIIVIKSDGSYLISKVADKAFVGKDIIHLAVFIKNNSRTIYNVIYRDGKSGITFIKRCSVEGLTRDKTYNLTKGTPNSKILYLTINPNGEAETVKVQLKPRPRLRNLFLELSFSDIAIKGKASMGNIVTKYHIHRISLKEKGESTLGGNKRWFNEEVLRLNTDGKGTYLGEFNDKELLLVIKKSGFIYTTNIDLSNHFDDDVLIIEKFNPKKIYSAVYFDGGQNLYYVKRFHPEKTTEPVRFIGEDASSKLIRITEVDFPRLEIQFGGKNKNRKNEIIEVDEFINVKNFKAKGKRLSNYEVEVIKELEPLKTPMEEIQDVIAEEESEKDDLPDEAKGSQMSLEF